MNTELKIGRREFLKVSASAGASLVIGFYLSGCKRAPTPVPKPTASPTTPPQPTASPTATAGPIPTPTAVPEPTAAPTAIPAAAEPFAPNAFLRIGPDGIITVTVHRSEMGQGVRTALPMIVAEELEADWSSIRVEQALADRVYGDQVTGGSTSIVESYTPLRRAGATAREMLIAAAAQVWGVEKKTCYAENGAVVHQPSGRRLTYGELAGIAATLPTPPSTEIALKDPKDFHIIGTRVGRVDNPQIVSGSAVYGLDVQVPGMLYAVVARPPAFGARLTSYDAAQAEAVTGVRHVVPVDSGIAVVADDTWAAVQGRAALEIAWDTGPNAGLSSADIRASFAEMIASADKRDVPDAAQTLEAIYEVPFLAHAPMEPVNCLADVRADSCEVWAPTQNPELAKRVARSLSRLPDEAVTVHVSLIGGGFGRRLEADYVAEAVRISQKVGAPVKVMWTREDDIRHDFYRPASYHWLKAGLDEQGWPVAWRHYIAAPGITGDLPAGGQAIVQGASDLPYRILDLAVRPLVADIPVPTGYWRAVFNTQNAFANECFVDELAAAGGRDPYELRMALLTEPRLKAVLELAATKAGWGEPLPAGWGRGIACHATWGSIHVAQVAEVSVADDGAVRVHRVVCAVDCGLVLNPDGVEAQMEGGIVFGLSAALKGEITIENGGVQQGNFHDYPVLRMDEMPVIETYIIQGRDRPNGTGEGGPPPIAPAVANAVFAATGKRIRRLPLRAENLRA